MNTTTNSKLNPVLTFKDLEEAFNKIKIDKILTQIQTSGQSDDKFLGDVLQKVDDERKKKNSWINIIDARVNPLLPKNVVMLGYNDESYDLLIWKEDGIYKWSGETVRWSLEEILNKGREQLREQVQEYTTDDRINDINKNFYIDSLINKY